MLDDPGDPAVSTNHLIFNEISNVNLGESDSGGIFITTPILMMNNRSAIASFTSDYGNGGDISINVDRLDAEGGFISVETENQGNAGTITINALEVILANKTTITASSHKLNPDAQEMNVFLDFRETNDFGEAGTILINASVLDIDNSSIAARTKTNSEGGDIIITAKDIEIHNESQITVETAEADAGNIHLNVGHLLQLNDNSAITTSAAVNSNQGSGNGGDINIKSTGVKPSFAILDDTSQIIAQAQRGSFIIKPLDGLQPTPEDYLSGFYTDRTTPTQAYSHNNPSLPQAIAMNHLADSLASDCTWY